MRQPLCHSARLLSLGRRQISVFRLSKPPERHGARLPFDFLLKSLADVYGPRVVGVILSGTGAEGSVGLKAVKAKRGLIIAQEVDEADFDGMPRSAIATGAVDLTAPVAKIAAALIERERGVAATLTPEGTHSARSAADVLPEIITLLRTKTVHDFSLYKHGTLARRVERRMGMASISRADDYLARLRRDSDELDSLSRDLLINVTAFFRDPGVFEYLAADAIPELVRSHSQERPLRVWVAGCSSGEETYSLAILLREQILADKREIKLQIFASDVDPDAVAIARDGLYPETIETAVSADRLSRFFTREEHAYRVAELRAAVVFTVQDLLADPPFARLDFISCRNVLIYLQPEAQARAVSIFNFALRERGLLLVGAAETIDQGNGRFEVVSSRIDLSSSRRHTPQRVSVLGQRERRAAPARSPRRSCSALAAGGPGGALSTARAGDLRACRRADQRKARMPAFPGPNGRLSEGGVRPAIAGVDRKGARGGADETQSRHSRCTGERDALRRHRRPDQRRRRHEVVNIAVEPVVHDGHDLMLVCFIETPTPERTVPPQLLEQRDDLGGFQLAEDRQFHHEQFPAPADGLAALLRRKNEYDETESRS